MPTEDLTTAWSRIESFEREMPVRGGCVMFSQDNHNPNGALVYGDRVGLGRLGWTILRYALTAKVSPGQTKAEALFLRGLFDEPSKLISLSLQLDERSREIADVEQRLKMQIKPGFLNLVARILGRDRHPKSASGRKGRNQKTDTT